jgi:hypothetical protein
MGIETRYDAFLWGDIHWLSRAESFARYEGYYPYRMNMSCLEKTKKTSDIGETIRNDPTGISPTWKKKQQEITMCLD